MTTKSVRVRVVDETTFRIHTHHEGFTAYETAYCTLSLEPFIERVVETRIDFTLMPNQEVATLLLLVLSVIGGCDRGPDRG